ncbi:GGDEF domain-containing protein [Sphingomonas sp. 8AM]|uniref:GGDEF domain-containing protein n=1 Tax=Sphingomonas sp. 8AM TaxID=2653170 RepID=UPI0012F0D628|nr:GGDEF domain-containing protein [Sphingomonas sp. 8AM]VXC42479.1 Sensor domain-containing diguanylate cyclase [Sphingomonas sp. 8AM]
MLYFCAAAATIHLTSNGRDIAAIWPANAILLAFLLLDKEPHWLTTLSAGFFGNVVANYLTRGTLSAPLLYSVANVIEIAIAAKLIGASSAMGGLLQSTKNSLRFLAAAGVIAPGVSGLIGAGTAFLVFGEPIGQSFLVWVLSDGLGLIVFTPVVLAVFRGEFITCFRGRTWLQRFETIALLSCTALIAYGVFFIAARPMLFVLFPPILFVTFRVGRLGTKAAVVIVALIGGIATMSTHGPIAILADGAVAQALLFQAFLGVLLVTCLPIAAEVTERARLTAALAEHDREMMKQATTDPLTGLLNRGGFRSMVASAFDNRDEKQPISLIAVDLDYFKSINDCWGHEVGDLALRHLASVLKAEVGPMDVIGRPGGDEFLILLPASDLHEASVVGQRIATAIRREPLSIDQTSVTLLSLSIGVAAASPNDQFVDLARRADGALYAAKKAGRNAIRLAS